MKQQELIPHLFRTEYKKIIAVLCKRFGMGQIETAEDIASDTFLAASEIWSLKGLPENPTAWLYTVAKNKTKDYFKHTKVFTSKIVSEIKLKQPIQEVEIDLSNKNINDSQLAMIFALCNPNISMEAQIGLALNILCGFGIEEIANAFLTNKIVIYKRLQRAKEKLKNENVKIEQPTLVEINERLGTVLATLYLLFNEGYYSVSQDTSIRAEFCVEAMQLNQLLLENEISNTIQVNALFSLMCFQSSRFDARTNKNGEAVLYENQDTSLWNKTLIEKGKYYLNEALKGSQLSKYQLEATIAFWHTQKEDSQEKWENILQLYNQLLLIEYSPIVALNRTYALAKANGKDEAIVEAEKINLAENHLYHSLLGNLYSDIDNKKAVEQYEIALRLAKSNSDRKIITKNITKLNEAIN
ncbi:MAG: DUF6596 domain-containing protein [Ginsengibacter sp.]